MTTSEKYADSVIAELCNVIDLNENQRTFVECVIAMAHLEGVEDGLNEAYKHILATEIAPHA